MCLFVPKKKKGVIWFLFVAVRNAKTEKVETWLENYAHGIYNTVKILYDQIFTLKNSTKQKTKQTNKKHVCQKLPYSTYLTNNQILTLLCTTPITNKQ